MKQNENKVFEVLRELNIKFEVIEHEAVATVAEAKKVCDFIEIGCKNLFLKDAKKQYYLVVMTDTKKANIKDISKQLDISRLSFAKEEELFELLGLKPGEVTPFGLINDKDKNVVVVLDEDLVKMERVCFHPNVNTSTLIIRYKDFEKYLEWCQNKIVKVFI